MAVVAILGIAAYSMLKNHVEIEIKTDEIPSSRRQEKPSELVQEPEKPTEEKKVESSKDFDDLVPDKYSPTCKAIEEVLENFSGIVDVKFGTETFTYLHHLYIEAEFQYKFDKSAHYLPLFYIQENFPTIGKVYGVDGDKQFQTLVGWLFAMALAELMPKKRTDIFRIGYELGCENKDTNIFGNSFENDPNTARLVASAIYAAVRGVVMPDVDKMREEVGGSKYDKTVGEMAGGTRIDVGEDDFFIDFREFMPTAPAPYAPAYSSNRPATPYPDEPRDDFGNLRTDREIHEMIVEQYNLDSDEYKQRVVQAIADKEGAKEHLFGEERHTEHYTFQPVFGKNVLGITIPPYSTLGEFAEDVFSASNSARGILQSAEVSPVQYGRLRPGCSWSQEGKKNSDTDDRRNVLVEIEIEDNDGCKDTPNTFGHYDENGYWVYTQTEADQYAESQKNTLYANSYPSGHSAGITGVAMMLIELFPQKADKILRAAIDFSLSRSICRYHWTSDIINGRVLGTAQNAVAHAASDYDLTLNKIKEGLSL